MAYYRKIKKKWSARIRVTGHPDESKSGFRTKKDAEDWAEPIEKRLRNTHSMLGLGPSKTSLAVALRDYAYAAVVKQGGCEQVICKINKYLAAAGLKTLKATKIRGGRVFGKGADGMPSELLQKVEEPLFKLTEQTEQKEVFKGARQKGFAKRRAANLKKGVRPQAHRETLARLKVSEIQPFHLTTLVALMNEDGYAGATQRQEIAILSAFISHAVREWNWPLPKNPALSFTWPTGSERERVMSDAETKRMATSLPKHDNEDVVRFVLLSIETAMRKGESLSTACWCDVDYAAKVLKLPHAKAGRREVPLSPEAISLLQEMPQGKPTENIFQMTQAALDSAWKRLCADAKIENLHIHDLRHTSATMWAELLNGDILKLQQITGHRTWKMLKRYVHIAARKVAEQLQAIEKPTVSAKMRAQMASATKEDSQAIGNPSQLLPVGVASIVAADPEPSQQQDMVVNAAVYEPTVSSPGEVAQNSRNVIDFRLHLEMRKAQHVGMAVAAV